MNLVPAVLERSILAGLLLLPVAGVLGFVALEGDAGLLTSGIVLAAAVIYAAVVWVAGARRELPAQLADPKPAPTDARVESLARTAGRAGLKALALFALAAVTSVVGLLVIGLAVAGGLGLVAALTAVRLRAWEARNQGRLVREPSERPWEPARPLRVF